MNAATDLPHLLQRPAIDGAQYLPLELVRANPHQPRKRFDAAKLDELAINIAKHGVLQPVLVRPAPDAKPGRPLFEVVAGERRWRACKLVADPAWCAKHLDPERAAACAGSPKVIPTIVRELTDFEALELATIENLQREDLHPMEEAEGYEALLRKPNGLHGYTADELAAKLGKSRSYIYGRLKLTALCKEARTAFYDDKISASVALLIARMPVEQQPECTKDILQGWGGDPFTHRQAQQHIHRHFMLELASAPFKITDATLVPAAGSCRECPKRTGANPDLFGDVRNADTCTDRVCFEAKTTAHRQRVIEQAKAEGREVITGKAADKAMPHGKYSLKGYLLLDDTPHRLVDTNKPLRKLLGKDGPAPVLIEDTRSGDLVEVVPEADALATLKDKGVIKTARMPTTSASERETALRVKRETAWRMAVATSCMEAANELAGTPEWLLRIVAQAMYKRLDHETRTTLHKLLGTSADNFKPDTHFAKLDRGAVQRELLAMAIAGESKGSTWSTAKPERLLAVAEALKVDHAAIKKAQATEERNKAAAVRKKAAAAKMPASTKPLAAAPAKAEAKPKKSSARAKKAEVAVAAIAEPGTPEAALAAAVLAGATSQPAPAPAVQLSDAAAWPFPADKQRPTPTPRKPRAAATGSPADKYAESAWPFPKGAV